MSLSVYLYETMPELQESAIYIRESGSVHTITRREWDEKYPGIEPIVVQEGETRRGEELFYRNITHNLNKMASEAGVYKALWRPEELGIDMAVDLIPLLEAGRRTLVADPDYFKTFNPHNGWGTYENLVVFITKYLEACMKYPNATIEIYR